MEGSTTFSILSLARYALESLTLIDSSLFKRVSHKYDAYFPYFLL